MGDFEVSLFSTKALYNKCYNEFGYGFQARDIAQSFIEGAFARSNNHDVYVDPASERVNAPVESINSSFDAPVPCNENLSGTWADLRQWWGYWFNEASCKDPHSSSKDCNLLLTAADDGGLGGPQEAVAGGAFIIAQNYSSYQNWDNDPVFNKVDTVLEELGHTLVGSMEDLDYISSGDGSKSHDSGDLYNHNGKYAITPIGITGDTDYNNCGEFVDKSDWDGDAWEARYSLCTESYFREK